MFTLLAALALSAPVPKADASIQWRLSKGDTFYVTWQTEQTCSGFGEFGGSHTLFVLTAKLTVADTSAKGASVQLEVLSFGSGRGGGFKKPDTTDHPKAAGKMATLTLDADRRVTQVASDKELADAEGPFGAGALTDDQLAAAVTDLTQSLPGKVLAKGDTWKGETTTRSGEHVTGTRTDRGTVTAVTDHAVTLAVECDRASSGKGLVVTESKGEQGKRAVVYDPKAGRVRSLTDDYTLTISHELDGKKSAFTCGIKTTVTVSDTAPKPTK